MTGEARPLEVAAAALARRDRSAAWLAAHLEGKGFAAVDAADAVARLRAAGYVDDVRFAAARAEALAGRGYGDEAIRSELNGVAAEAAEAAVAALAPETERALAVLRRAKSPLAGLRRLVAKGFSADAIESAVAAQRHDAGEGPSSR